MIGSATALRPRDRSSHVIPSTSALKALIVEDDAAVAAILADMLGDLGHQVVATEATRDAALVTAATIQADVAILDINLGGRPVFPIADRLMERDIPVVFATGYGILELTGKYENAALLKKPFDAAGLAAILNRLQRAA